MNHGSSDAAAAGIAFLGFFYLFIVTVVIAVYAVTIWFYWRIFERTGYSGALSLLNLVPGVGNLVCILILAFGRWPIEDRLAAAEAGTPYPAPPPPPVPPGTAVMPQ
jgi:hypothetical protein